MKLNDFFEKIKINKKIFFLIYLISITIISIFYASSKSQDEAFFVINFIMIFSALSAGIIFLIIFGVLLGISIFWVLQFLLLPLIFVMNYKNLEKLLTILGLTITILCTILFVYHNFVVIFKLKSFPVIEFFLINR